MKPFLCVKSTQLTKKAGICRKCWHSTPARVWVPGVLHTDSGSFSPSPPHNTKPLLRSQDGLLLPMKPPLCPLSPESLQPNLTFGSQTWVTPSQLFSSLESMQSVSPSQRHRRGMHRPSSRHWNSSEWQPPGGLVAGGHGRGWGVCIRRERHSGQVSPTTSA